MDKSTGTPSLEEKKAPPNFDTTPAPSDHRSGRRADRETHQNQINWSKSVSETSLHVISY